MRKLLSLMILGILILFSGCSLKQADTPIPKKAVDSEQSVFTQAIMNFYGDTSESIVVYQQIPFEVGTLVLLKS